MNKDNARSFYNEDKAIFYISAGKRENTQLPTKYRKDINSFGIVTYIMKMYWMYTFNRTETCNNYVYLENKYHRNKLATIGILIFFSILL